MTAPKVTAEQRAELRARAIGNLRAPADSSLYRRATSMLALLDEHAAQAEELERLRERVERIRALDESGEVSTDDLIDFMTDMCDAVSAHARGATPQQSAPDGAEGE